MIDDALREELSALIDGALPEERAKELRRRIREDKDLSREYAELERAVLAVRALPRTGAPPELRARLDVSLRPRRGRILRLGVLAVAATVLLAVGLALHLRGGGAPRHFEAKDEPPAPQGIPAEAQAPSDRREAKDESALKKGAPVADERAKQDGAKLGAARGAPAKKEAADLLAKVAKSRKVEAADRKAYLRQLVALDPGKALEHVRAVVGDEFAVEIRPQPRDGSPPVLAAIRLEDREEADLVERILGTPPAPAGPATAVAVEQAENQVTADVRGTPEDLARLGRWLALLDLAPAKVARPRVQVFGEAKREKAAAEAEPPVETAIVRLSFGKVPEPAVEETPTEDR